MILSAAVLGLAAPAGPAMAAPARLAWSTYLRAGPRQMAVAVDELEHDRAVDLMGCAGAWCRVGVAGAVGYVDRDALMPPRPVPAAGAAAITCTVAAQPGSRRPEPTRFCASR